MNAPNELRAFQLSLGKYLRSPETETLPSGIEPRRARVYEELLFNNVCGFINNCFPVVKSLVSEDSWANMIRTFFSTWRAKSPLFKDIPEEFLQFLQRSTLLESLPPWFFELAHYEWVELYIDTSSANSPAPQSGKVVLNQPILPLIYEWPVHKICKDFQPQEKQETCLIVYRDTSNEVRFIETNAATILLLQLLEQAPLSSQELFETLAQTFNRSCDNQFVGFCGEIVKDLTQQSVLI